MAVGWRGVEVGGIGVVVGGAGVGIGGTGVALGWSGVGASGNGVVVAGAGVAADCDAPHPTIRSVANVKPATCVSSFLQFISPSLAGSVSRLGSAHLGQSLSMQNPTLPTI